jgi:heme-degrading monooxygenase HmoA
MYRFNRSRYESRVNRFVPGSYGLRYMAYSIHSGTKSEHLMGFEHTTLQQAKKDLYKLVSKWNSQAYGNIQYWVLEEK